MTATNLCRFIASPLRWLPQRIHGGGLSLMLNHLLAHPMADGELDFLRNRVVNLEITDIGIKFRLQLGEQGFSSVPTTSTDADVRFSGDLLTFLLLATQREDADTLFFQRRLRIQGDTALGLHLKNFLDAMEELPLPGPARQGLEHFTDLYSRRCGAPLTTQTPQFNPGRPIQ